MKIITRQICKTGYFTRSFERKSNFLELGYNEGPVVTFVATLIIALDNAALVHYCKNTKNNVHIRGSGQYWY